MTPSRLHTRKDLSVHDSELLDFQLRDIIWREQRLFDLYPLDTVEKKVVRSLDATNLHLDLFVLGAQGRSKQGFNYLFLLDTGARSLLKEGVGV
jgi:hypothetical protein